MDLKTFLPSSVLFQPLGIITYSSRRISAKDSVCPLSFLKRVNPCQHHVLPSLRKNIFGLGQSFWRVAVEHGKVLKYFKTKLLVKPGRFATSVSNSADNFVSIETSDLVERNIGALEGNKRKWNHNWLLQLLLLGVAVAATTTIIAIWRMNGFRLGAHVGGILVNKAETDAQGCFSFKFFGTKVALGEHPPGWVYFWLLMAAGFGLFVSEEALNVWVGATLARPLTFNGSWEAFIASVLRDYQYIVSTIFWVYWGVCISDMIPFYAGKFSARTKTGESLREKIGVSNEKLQRITATVQRYGNLIGFVERFSLGVRNPTSFLAGAVGVSPENYFAGVCLGALITLPIQMGVGCALRERPVEALAGVAAAVGLWTIFPYAAAGLASLWFVLRNRWKK